MLQFHSFVTKQVGNSGLMPSVMSLYKCNSAPPGITRAYIVTSSTPWSARVGTDVYQAEHLPCLAAQERDTALDHVVYLRVGQFISGFGGTKDATPATKLRLKGVVL